MGQLLRKASDCLKQPSNAMQLRHFRIGDEPALYAVYFSAVHQIAARDYSQEQLNAWAPAERDEKAWKNRMRTIVPFVVEHEGEIVGYADLQNSGYINHFFVSGFKSRLGIGRLLMDRILLEAQLLRLAEITADVSKSAETFFERYGFQLVERRSPVRRGVVLHNAFMRKTL